MTIRSALPTIFWQRALVGCCSVASVGIEDEEGTVFEKSGTDSQRDVVKAALADFP
jgi:hypothetical protein